MTLGEKIKKYRLLRGLTQAQLGAKVKLSGDRIRQYENDVRKPKDEKLFQICDALEINLTALDDLNCYDPSSVMHTLFELEDIFGLHFEKVGDNFQLAFSKGDDYRNNNWLIEGISSWIEKRNEVQPDISDSANTIADKKKDYAIWKARYPYNFNEEIVENFSKVSKFHNECESLLNQDRKIIKTFAEFYKKLLNLETLGIEYSLSDRNHDNELEAVFKIKYDYITNASEETKAAYIDFRACWYDMKELGIELNAHPLPIENELYICISSTNMQLITLFQAHIELDEKKSSPSFDEDDYKYETENILKAFNILIKEYV